MANDIKVSTSIQHTKEPKIGVPSGTASVTQTGTGVWSDTVSVTTSDGAISTSGVGTMGWAYIKNLDATNYVTLGPTSGGALVPLLRLKAGEAALLRLEPGIALRGQANTATCLVFVQIYED